MQKSRLGFGLHFKGPFAAAQLQNARRLPKGGRR